MIMYSLYYLILKFNIKPLPVQFNPLLVTNSLKKSNETVISLLLIFMVVHHDKTDSL